MYLFLSLKLSSSLQNFFENYFLPFSIIPELIKPFILVALMVCLMLSAIADPYQTGHSYDNAGQRVDGLLWYTQGAFGMLFNTPGKLAFKENADSKKIWLTV